MDRYSKVVLTVIAVALVWIGLKPVVQPAYADGPMTVECIMPAVQDVNIAEIYGSSPGVLQVLDMSAR